MAEIIPPPPEPPDEDNGYMESKLMPHYEFGQPRHPFEKPIYYSQIRFVKIRKGYRISSFDLKATHKYASSLPGGEIWTSV